jgi:predicted dehydrogenase
VGISLGLVGLGAFGNSFAPMFKNHPLVDRVALCDREPERIKFWADKPFFADKFDPGDTYDSLEEILKSDVDALVLITQPWLHAEQAVMAMEAGKDVYSAVPIVSLPDGDEILDWCDKIIRTCEKTGQKYMLGETTYYRPEAMFCRRKAAEGAFGDFVYCEGEYFHDMDHGLREVIAHRTSSASGKEWLELEKKYIERGVVTGPMHYPTHSTSGPVLTMNAHAVKVSAQPYYSQSKDPAFGSGQRPISETALFKMSNGSSVRICEYRQIGMPCRETFRVYGTEGSFEHGQWFSKNQGTPVSEDQMREPLPAEVAEAFKGHRKLNVENVDKLSTQEREDFLGGHGGSHGYLVHEFVSAISEGRMPAINAWEAARYMAMGVSAHKSALKDGELLDVPDWGDAPGGS